MSTTTEGIPEESDWARPVGCDCFTWARHEQCCENCDPVEPKATTGTGIERMKLIVKIILALLAAIYLIGAFATMSQQSHAADLDVAWRLPNYCDGLKLMERSCTSVKTMAKVYGRSTAERRARACGATDADIAEAAKCFDPKK